MGQKIARVVRDDKGLIQSVVFDGVAAAAEPAGSSQSLQETTRFMLKVLERKPDPAFDRIQYAATVRANRARSATVVVGGYDPVRFLVAHKQYHADSARLTDDDIAQLSLVDPDLGDEARAARAGFIKDAGPKHDAAMARVPVSMLTLMTYVTDIVDQLKAWIGTVQYKAREADVRLDVLEAAAPFVEAKVSTAHARLDALEAANADRMAQSALTRIDALEGAMKTAPISPVELKALRQRLEILEQKPSIEYQGVWAEGTFYSKGAAVTRDGSLWIAKEANMVKPGDHSPASRAWQLAVTRGRDGKDARDTSSIDAKDIRNNSRPPHR